MSLKWSRLKLLIFKTNQVFSFTIWGLFFYLRKELPERFLPFIFVVKRKVCGQLGHYSKRFLPKRFGKEKTNVPTQENVTNIVRFESFGKPSLRNEGETKRLRKGEIEIFLRSISYTHYQSDWLFEKSEFLYLFVKRYNICE